MHFNAINLLNIIISCEDIFDRIFYIFPFVFKVFHIFKQKVIKEIEN